MKYIYYAKTNRQGSGHAPPHALQLLDLRLDGALLLPALPLVPVGIVLSSAPSIPLMGCKTELPAAP